MLPLVTGGRYGLSSKELTPGMVAGIFAELARERPLPRFTIGIHDDVSGLSLPYDPSLDIEPPGTIRAVFFGLGSTARSARTRTRSRSSAPRRT